jgi:amino acid transporter
MSTLERATQRDEPERREKQEPERDEDPKERRDRELMELLNELRVALPGVQVLFAFLLTVPFTQRFNQLTSLQRDVFFAAFIAAALATALLMAPTSFHRIRFRQADKERLLRLGNASAIAGLVTLLIAIATSVFLITDLLFEAAWASLVMALLTGFYVFLWFGIPLSRRMRDGIHERDEENDEDEG